MDMITLVIEVLIFTALIGTIGAAVSSVENVTGAALILVGLITLVVIAGFIVYLGKQMKIKAGR